MKAETWVSSSALLNRMNFALALTAGKIKGVKLDSAQLHSAGDANADLSSMEAKLLGADVSKQTHDSIVAQLTSPAPEQNKPPQSKPPDANAMAGLLLGSPEFQRR
jgi:hypothetical protein